MARQWTIAKGLRRLWVVLTVCWMLVVPGWLVHISVEQDEENLSIARLQARAWCQLEPIEVREECESREFRKMRHEGGAWGQFVDSVASAGYLKSGAYILGAILIPPLLLLGAGWATYRIVVWVGRGFVSA